MRIVHMRKSLLFIIGFTVFFGGNVSVAQPSLTFGHLNIDDGLRSNTVTSIAQDSLGYMWFGTDNGLSRYDGYEFKSYQYLQNDTTSLCENHVNVLFTDSRGRLWIGTNEGISRFNGESDNFTNFYPSKDTSTFVTINTFYSFTEDTSGVVFTVNLLGNIFSFDEKSQQFKQLPVKPSDASIKSLFFDKQNALWIGQSNGLGHIHNGIYTVYNFPGVEKENSVFHIFQHGDTLLLSTLPGGIIKFDMHNKVFFSPEHDISNIEAFHTMQDPEGQLWFSTIAGIFKLNPRNSQIEQYAADDYNPYSIAVSGVRQSYTDSQGNKWFATVGGGVNYIEKGKNFYTRKKKPGLANSLSSKIVFSVYEFENKCFVGYDDGLDAFSLDLTKKIANWNNESQIGFGNTFCIYVLNKQLFIGKYMNGLMYWSDKEGTFKKFPFPDSLKHINKDVRSITSDSKGALWLVAHGNGIVKIDLNTSSFRHYTMTNSGLMHDWANYIYCDSKDNIYVAFNTGMALLKNGEQSFFNFTKETNDSSSISSNAVYTFFEDSKKRLWVGTNYGLNRFLPEEQKFIRYTDSKTNERHSIQAILEDSSRNLWIATQGSGLLKLNTRGLTDTTVHIAGRIHIYDKSDGVSSNNFSRNAAFKSSRGEMYFGSTEGLTWFTPEEIIPNKTPPKVHITSFRLFNKEAGIKSKNALLDKHIRHTKQLTLLPEHKVISFGFTAINYIQPEKNQYAYMLKGFEKAWNYIGTKREATYTNIPPGNYEFRVKASNNDGVWSTDYAKIQLVVLPPFWKTLWFKTLVTLFAGLLLFMFVRLRSYQYKQKQKELENLVNERTISLKQATAELQKANESKIRFFMNVSHEFRTPLTLIIGPLDNILQNSLSPAIRSQVLLMQRNTRRLLRLVNQLLDLRKLETGSMKLHIARADIVSFMRSIFESFNYLAKRGNINYTFISKISDSNLWFDADVVDKVLYNLISNAFKYSASGDKVEVTVDEVKNGVLYFSVTDTGVGMPGHELTNIFDRFYQVKAADKRKNNSTGIGLSLTRELIELHKGEISVESEIGKGTAFHCSISVDKNAFNENDLVDELNTIEIEKYPHITKEDENVLEDTTEQNPINIVDPQNSNPVLLLIDDNKDLRLHLRHGLKDKYTIFEAENGEKGLEVAIEHMPDIIVTDVMMPVMDGFELCGKLKTNTETSHIPVIMLTARSSEEHEISGLSTGADDYLAKPFNMEILRLKINNLVETRKKLQDFFNKNIHANPAEVTSTPLDEKFIQDAVNIIALNISDTTFSVESMAEKMGLSRSTLLRKCKAITGLTVNDFIKNQRLKKAAILLKEKKYNVSQACYDTGFSDPNYFSQIFKKQFGVTPSQYT